jgi:hypothetical protein
MATLAISIDVPPIGELEISGDGSSPTDAQMDEEMHARQRFLDIVSPYFALLPNRPLHRKDNVSRVELLGAKVWSQLNHYLLLVTIDIGDAGIEQDLLSKAARGIQGVGRGC